MIKHFYFNLLKSNKNFYYFLFFRQRNSYEHGSPSRPAYNPDPGYLHPSLLSRNKPERSRQEELFSVGSSQRPIFLNQPPTPSSIKEDSQESFKAMNADQNDVSYTPFKPPPQLNTVEDEDEFLYGDATPVVETPSSRTEELPTRKQGIYALKNCLLNWKLIF